MLPLRPSRQFAGGLLVLHLTIILAPWAAGLALPICLAMGVLALFAGYGAWQGWRRSAGLCLHLMDEGGLAISRHGGEPVWVSLSPDSRDLALLIVLHWREDATGLCGSACLLRDSLAPEEWRHLRAWLRWRGTRATPPTSSV